jgi:hypothetical protein
MTTSRCNLSFACGITLVAIMLALPGRLPAQTAAAKSAGGNGTSGAHWSVQVEQVDSGNLDLAYSFQLAIYENLLDELNKTKQFQQVFRDGDVRAGGFPNMVVLKTTVERYTPGSETRRAVTTVSGATKLTVRSQLLTREGKVILERTVNGDVRFFGSNLRATHNLAHNIAKTIKQSSWSGSGQPTAMGIAGQADVASAADMERLFKESMDPFGRPHVVVHGAGIMPLFSIASGDVTAFDEVIATNLRGAFLVVA